MGKTITPTVVIEIVTDSSKSAPKLIAYFQKELKGHCASIYVFKEPRYTKKHRLASITLGLDRR